MKQIKDFPTYYVTIDGEVFSEKSNRMLSKSKCNSGYYTLTLSHKGKHQSFGVHRLVAETYIENPLNKKTVNHIDGNKTNNHVSNLEWATHKENSTHSIRVLGNKKPPTMEGKFGKDHNKSKAVYLYNDNGDYLYTFGGLSEASRMIGCSISSVSYSMKTGFTIYGHYFFGEKNFNPNLSVKRDSVRLKSKDKIDNFLLQIKK